METKLQRRNTLFWDPIAGEFSLIEAEIIEANNVEEFKKKLELYLKKEKTVIFIRFFEKDGEYVDETSAVVGSLDENGDPSQTNWYVPSCETTVKLNGEINWVN